MTKHAHSWWPRRITERRQKADNRKGGSSGALRVALLGLLLVCWGALGPVHAQESAAPESTESLESLLDVRVSTASKYEQSAREAPASVTIVTAEDIAAHGYQTLADVLVTQRGFYISNDRSYNYTGVRGFGRPTDFNNRVLIMVDGVALNEPVYSSAPLGSGLPVPMEAVERIEIVRGPGSALYGANAMFAVINVITRSDVHGAALSADVGSFGRKTASIVAGTPLSERAHITVAGYGGDITGPDVYVAALDNPGTNNGRARGRDYDRFGGITSTLRFEPVTVQVRANRRRKGIPNGAWGTLFNDPDIWTDNSWAALSARYENPIGLGKRLHVEGHLSAHRNRGSYPYVYEGERYDWRDETTNDWGGMESWLQWDTSPANRLMIGAEVQHHGRVRYRAFDAGEPYLSFDAPFSIYSVFVQDEYQVTPRLAVMLGGRHDQYTNVGGATTPRVAVVYSPFRTGTAKLLYGSAFRAPSAYEMEYEDEIGGFLRSEGLDPERIHTAEAVWEQRFTRSVSGVLSLYRYKVDDLIDPLVNPVDETTVYCNTGEAYARGLEAEMYTRRPSGWQGYASYSLQYTRDMGSDTELSNAPHHLLKGGMVVPVGARVRTALDLRYESSRLNLDGTRTSAFVLGDLTVNAAPLVGPVDLTVRLRNLFDTNYAYPSGVEHVEAFIPQDGRSASVGLRLNLSRESR